MVLMEIATALGVSITTLVIYLRNAGLGELYSYFLFRPYPLIKKKIEIDDNNSTRYKTITLTFAYPKGKYLPVEVEKGDELKLKGPGIKPTDYSPSSIRDGEFDITVKVYHDHIGGTSSYLDSVKLNENVWMTGPFPPFKSMKKVNYGSQLGIIAYGVGITEALPVILYEMNHNNNTTFKKKEIVFIYCNRCTDDIVFFKKINNLSLLNKNENVKLRIVHVLSREKNDMQNTQGNIEEGIIEGNNVTYLYNQRLNTSTLSTCFKYWVDLNEEELESETINTKSTPHFLVIGTKQMIGDTWNMIKNIGVDVNRTSLYFPNKERKIQFLMKKSMMAAKM